MRPWVGVDLDGTLAHHESGQGEQIGEPIPRMVEFVKSLIKDGTEVRIFTARVGLQPDPEYIGRATVAIRQWCLKHLGTVLKITCCKDFGMVLLYDDRAITIEKNTGRLRTEMKK